MIAIERFSDQFRLITLAAPELKNAKWVAGQKIQIAMGSAFVGRTYTPLDWDPSDGKTRILAFAHGQGPGNDWIRGPDIGDECSIFGPRASVDDAAHATPLAIFGDETSIGLVYTLASRKKDRPVSCYLEVGDFECCSRIMKQLGIRSAHLYARAHDNTHLEELSAALPALAAEGVSLILTGNAKTIQQLKWRLKQFSVSTKRITTKAYWAPGKPGLD